MFLRVGDSVDIFYKSRLPDLISSTPMSSMSPPSRPAPLLHHPSFALPPSLGAGNFLQNLPRSPFPQMSGIGRSAKVSEPFLRPHFTPRNSFKCPIQN